ncbi:two-component regulator propeller domain-containing protein [Gaetbulibacter jejuensis]|uniref:histidine kinase n=1 Tax=Gaetbulibacter jejuensis TaxID=584607 RepID=A0ABN1JUQ6_9FLAO
MTLWRYKTVDNFIVIFLTVLYTLFCSGQETITEKPFSFNTLTINDGLSQNSVISIAQDSIGYLWLATQDGLNKYNGKSFKHYDKQFEDITRPNFSKLGKIYIDKQNRLWIITNSGNLELYNPKTDTFKHLERFNNVSSIFQDKALHNYIGTYGKGLFKIDTTTKDTLQVLNDHDKLKTIYEFIETDTAIIAAASGAVFQINNNTYNEINVESHTNANFSALTKDKDDNIWLGTFGQGLYLKENNKVSFIKYQHSQLPNDLNIEDLLIDSKNRLWIATYGNGAYLLNLENNTVTNFKADKNNPFAIHYNDILCLYEDATGVIWLGSDGTGASYYDAHLIKFNVLTNNQVPKNVNVDVVRSISTDVNNNLWIGTSGKGLTHINFNNNEYKTYTINNSSIASDRIISLLYNNNKLWIGHQGFGLNIRTDSGDYHSFPEISNLTIWRIIKENDNQSWLCTERNGIILFDIDKGIVKQFNTDNSTLSTNDIKTAIKGNEHTLWIGTDDKGLYNLNLKTNEITNIKSLNDKIKSLHYDNEILWIGTNGKGLKKYNTINGSLDVYNKVDGLPNNVIYGILPDKENNLWLSTNYGISKLNIKDTIFENYSNYDGLQALEFNTGAYYKDENENLYFGGLEGLNWFNPNQLTFNPIKPKTIISKFEIFTEGYPLKQNSTFKFNQNTVTFTFSSLHFSQPERNLYKYQLVNHDENWINSENNNSAHYTNLPPNDYTFKVISSNYDGVWNTTPATFTFTILQPWYLSKLAIVCYALLFLISMYLLYRYFKWRWHMKMQLQFEHNETERLKKLDEFKTRIYTNISHEFRTPLTLISGPIEKQLSKSNLTEDDKKELSLVQNNSKRLLNLVNQLLDLSKLESGNLKLSVSKGNITAFLKQIAASFEYKAKDKNIHFSHKIQSIPEAWFDKDVIEKITTNLLSNAVKYAPVNGQIYFAAIEKNGQIIITIINNGNTISSKELSKLFQRYYQNNKNADGVGIGLSLVKELAILSHGNIVAHTMNTDDIQFTVTLPIERSFYNISEINEDTKTVNDELDTVIETPETSEEQAINNSKDKPILLIVEDDKDIREFISSIFKNDYDIKEAPNGESGIKKAIKYIPDIIISDIMMPKIDGIELCNTLKKDEKTSHIPIILLTAKSGDENEIKGLETGADDYIVKPFNSNKLKIRVEKLIELRQKLQSRYSAHFELSSISTTPVDQQFLTKLKTILNDYIIDSSFNSNVLSKKMAMSRMQLHRKLKAITGFSTTEFIRNERLKLAVNLLKDSDLNISEIAYQVGFNTPSYFIKCFKDVYKSTPSEFTSNQ